eukprot:CFRG6162T1
MDKVAPKVRRACTSVGMLQEAWAGAARPIIAAEINSSTETTYEGVVDDVVEEPFPLGFYAQNLESAILAVREEHNARCTEDSPNDGGAVGQQTKYSLPKKSTIKEYIAMAYSIEEETGQRTQGEDQRKEMTSLPG